MRLLVVGASGQVGAAVGRLAEAAGHEVIGGFVSRPPDRPADRMVRIDKGEVDTIRPAIERIRPDGIVDTGALHNVDYCESHPGEAERVNRDGTAALAEAAARVDAAFLFVSTDFVFDGSGSPPYSETDPARPLSAYGRSKLEGEVLASRRHPRAIIVRPSVIYSWIAPEARKASISQKGVNFGSWVVDELAQGKAVSIVNDQIASPTLADDLAGGILALLQQEEHGLFHVAGATPLSRFDFTVQLARRLGLPVELVRPVSTTSLKQVAARPPNSSLDSSKLTRVTGYRTHPIDEALARFAATWRSSAPPSAH